MVGGRSLATVADYDTTGTGSRPGLHVKEIEARICWEACDHPDTDCVCDGLPKPYLGRCALERYRAGGRSNGKQYKIKVPEGYLLVSEVAQIIKRSKENIRRGLNKGEFPGARKLGSSRTAPWIVPKKDIINNL